MTFQKQKHCKSVFHFYQLLSDDSARRAHAERKENVDLTLKDTYVIDKKTYLQVDLHLEILQMRNGFRTFTQYYIKKIYLF